jgi:hypothetical protein
MKLLFLDIDGVLNSHDQHPNGYCGIHPEKVMLLNGIVEKTNCKIVISSAWRYMILRGDMTLKGFGNLLGTYGASSATTRALHGNLPKDRDTDDLHDRGKLVDNYIATWMSHMSDHCKEPFTLTAVAIDDGTSGHPNHPDGTDLGYEACGIPIVRPIGKRGLQPEEAARVIEMLNGVTR